MTQSAVTEIEASIESHRAVVQVGAAINRLERNADFKSVVLEGYLREEAIRLVQARTDPAMQKPEQQADLIRQIDAIACFKDFMRIRLRMADHAAGAIDEAEEVRDQLLAEDVE